ncbi:F-box protein [Camellia lanceoleosa]|uniref:F-box protein n=1 Tax=Camellia lanceoleosa TaxID=1840588 RepID=A0ACC0GYW6_9ERIC|nr:F-box protein [Camellia lanceoleosa]
MSSVRPDLTTKVYPEPYTSSSSDEINHFDLLPNSILLLIFNKIGDVKALGRCCVISRRFYTLGGVTHHSPAQVLKNFNEIWCLRIELPSGELGIDEGVLFKRA